MEFFSSNIHLLTVYLMIASNATWVWMVASSSGGFQRELSRPTLLHSEFPRRRNGGCGKILILPANEPLRLSTPTFSAFRG